MAPGNPRRPSADPNSSPENGESGANAAGSHPSYPGGEREKTEAEPLPVLRSVWTLRRSLPGKSQSSPVTRGILVSSVADSASPTRTIISGELLLPSGSHPITALVDSGPDKSIMDRSLALRLGLHPERLPSPISARALDGHVLGRVTSQTNPVHMLLPGCHRETIRFMFLPTPRQPVNLGHSGLRRQNPNIDWSTCSIREWGVTCLHSCLKTQSPLPSLLAAAPFSDISGVPAVYHELRDVFNKAKATSLPPPVPMIEPLISFRALTPQGTFALPLRLRATSHGGVLGLQDISAMYDISI